MTRQPNLAESAGQSLHELNNILAVALARTEALLVDGAGTDLARRTEALRSIRDSFLRARTTIVDLRRLLRGAPSSPPPAVAAPAEREAGRVLLIDDDPRILDALSGLLAATGYAVETAQSGEEGLARFRRQRFDCVVTDARLTGISGLIVSRAVKDADPRAHVVLLTGADHDPEELRAAGVDRVIEKPTRRAEILEAVRGAAL